ncbi:hypothetical protein H3Z85_15600 [Chryseobacterium indologenes]|uniref:hypothetical protein n=1 Tax=Chryseobacterium TaxID=59732 RepID=UPI0008F3D33B|nr:MULTISPECIES: hypothetical protein [Chryseobacterium]MBF6645126.1 hypothetical protein [Chryseobacterium indologenes]MBU3049516.1 hypothetical protein [Chryseobacterium indologenes]MEB4759409.1 hypothetical protein [Chryseobacterium indologenes]QIX83476.1 hypothetical protein FOB56_20490 [Chryseobacterium indologenes]QPQ50812.1 hypothetical protein H3Z85_15600 [Chryseobacterium indologenes]
MKNLRNNKLSREQLKGISGNGIIIGNCSNECCPTDGRPRCPRLICPAVVCPQYM